MIKLFINIVERCSTNTLKRVIIPIIGMVHLYVFLFLTTRMVDDVSFQFLDFIFPDVTLNELIHSRHFTVILGIFAVIFASFYITVFSEIQEREQYGESHRFFRKMFK